MRPYPWPSQDMSRAGISRRHSVFIGRAVQRCGQLLKEFQTGPDGGRPSKNGGGTPTVSQRQAADEAGMSKDQEVQAVRVANVPEDEFEEAFKSESPPPAFNGHFPIIGVHSGNGHERQVAISVRLAFSWPCRGGSGFFGTLQPSPTLHTTRRRRGNKLVCVAIN